MNEPEMMEPDVIKILTKIRNKEFSENLRYTINQNEKYFSEMGITSEEINDLLYLKGEAEEYPDSDFYGVYDPFRANYIYDNMAKPDIKLRQINERNYYYAVRSCESWRVKYERKAEELSIRVTKILCGQDVKHRSDEQRKQEGQRDIKGWFSKGMNKMRDLLTGNKESETTGQGLNIDMPPVKTGDKKGDFRDIIPSAVEPIGNMESREVVQLARDNDIYSLNGPNHQVKNTEPIASKSYGAPSDMAGEEDYDKLWVFTGEQKLASDGVTVLNRIKANRYLYFVYGIDVLKDEPGGWIENEDNLKGYSWVGNDAEVYGHAKIIDSAVMGNAIVKDNARVETDSCITDNAQVTGSSVIKERSIVAGNGRVGDTSVIEKSSVCGYSSISGHSYVKGSTCDDNICIVDSGVCNNDMSGDIYINSSGSDEKSLQKIRDMKVDIEERSIVYSYSPSLIDNVLMNKLRANQEGGLKREVILSANDKELIADLSFIKDSKSWPMELLVSNPAIRYNGVEYSVQKVVDRLKDFGYPIEKVSPDRIIDMLKDIPHEFGNQHYVIRPVNGEFIMQDIAKTEQISKVDNVKVNPGLVSSGSLSEHPYVFTGQEKLASDQTTVLRQICANQDFSFLNQEDVSKGTVGGWIESEENLKGYSWVGNDAEVYGDARIVNSVVTDNSIVRDTALVEESIIKENAEIKDNTAVVKSLVGGQVQVSHISVIDRSVVDGYGFVNGESYLLNSICRKNTHITDSWLDNVRMEGDFEILKESLDFKRNRFGKANFNYSPPAVIVDSILDKLRANPKTGLKKVSLFGESGKEFIADLNLAKVENMRMKLEISNPVIRYNGVSYNGQKIIDQIKELGYDITEIHFDDLSAMLAGKTKLFNSKEYVIQQKGENFELVDVRERISNVDIYPMRDGEMAIRCVVDGVQQGAREMKKEDFRLLGEETDKKALAVRYFADTFMENNEKEYALGR